MSIKYVLINGKHLFFGHYLRIVVKFGCARKFDSALSKCCLLYNSILPEVPGRMRTTPTRNSSSRTIKQVATTGDQTTTLDKRHHSKSCYLIKS